MAKTYQIAVVGDWESVMGFRALGLSTYPVTSVDEAKKTIHDLAKADCAQGIGYSLQMTLHRSAQYLQAYLHHDGMMPVCSCMMERSCLSMFLSISRML